MDDATRNLRFELFCIHRIGIEKRPIPRTDRSCNREFHAWERYHRAALDLVATDSIAGMYASFDGILADRKRLRLTFILTHLLVRSEQEKSS
jgi:hypothetical protein